MPPEMVRCSTCGKTYKSIRALCDHEDKCKSPEKLGRNAAGQEEVLSSAQCGQLGLNVPDNNDNPAFDDAWGSNNDAMGFGMPKQKQPSLTEPEQKLDVVEAPQPLQEQLGEDTTSDDEPRTDSPGDGSAADDSHRDTTSDDDPRTDSPGDKSAADDSDEVLTSDSEKSLCSVECHGGGERTGNLQDVMEVYGAAHILLMLKSATETDYGDPIGGIDKGENGAPIVKVELSCTDDSQGVSDRSEKPAVSELKRPKLDPEVLHDSAATEEKKQKIDLDAPAPTNSSGEERSDVTDSQTSQST